VIDERDRKPRRLAGFSLSTHEESGMTRIGFIRELRRYPVKSMAGVAIESVNLGWHGLDGDRRFAFRRVRDGSGFPWLSASSFPELILYQPIAFDESSGEPLPTHVRTPSGNELELGSEALRSEIAEASGIEVELMRLKHGTFDEAPVSVISFSTIAGIGRSVQLDLDRRRFRANIVIETLETDAFLEDSWVGRTLSFGDSEPAPAVSVTLRDLRCMIINLDPETAKQDGRVLKKVVEMNGNNAGVYGTVLQSGTLHVGQVVSLV
jgi:uncharacterized protein